MAKTLKIWHTQKHDDYTTTNLAFDEKRGLIGMCKDMATEGGFWDGEGFVPWVRVSYVQIEES